MDLLESLIRATLQQTEGARSRLDAFLAEPRLVESLLVWLAPEPGEPAPTQQELLSRLALDVAALDEAIETQLNAILHHDELQRLEASWLGLQWLVQGVPEDVNVKVRLLDASWRDLAKDADRAIEFDQSELFKKVYSAEFGMPGGEPYGVLLGDYYVSHRIRPDQRTDDIDVLRSLSQVAAAAFSPLIVAAHESLLGIDSFRELDTPSTLEQTFRGKEYLRWASLRKEPDTRYLSLVLPRVLMRGPYQHEPDRHDGFPFLERCHRHEDYVWGNACYAMGSVIIRAFADWGWVADIRGARRGSESGGLVTRLPAVDHGTDSEGVAVRFPFEVVVTDRRERVLAEIGLTSLCGRVGESHAVFYSTPSLHDPPTMDSDDATANARLGALMQYVLCSSRVAHYIKVICRDMTGSLIRMEEIRKRLKGWLSGITSANDNASEEAQARFPLRDSEVTLREVPGKPGCYASVFHLRPHFQLDQMTSTIRLVTELVTGK